jgi:thymidylate synthase (FAD)
MYQTAHLVGSTFIGPAHKGTDLETSVAYIARVSNPTSQVSNKDPRKLIQYLIDHKHWSPFEMVNVVMEVVTSRDIARQLLRHRSFSFQEFSQRYSATETNVGLREARLQDFSNRQNSLPTDDKELQKWWKDVQKDVQDTSFELYDKALKRGIAKEQARVILPEGLTRSKLYVNGALRSWIHYIELRTSRETQKEHRELAYLCSLEVAKVFPLIEQFVDKSYLIDNYEE